MLDMGEPVKLVDLTRQMVELSGCTVRDSQKPDGGIAITFTGLRPGEKLYEELLLSDSEQPTGHPFIRQAQERRLAKVELAVLLSQPEQHLKIWDAVKAVDVLQSLIAGYRLNTIFQ